MNKTIHIVSFDVPFPPNYGGIIDVFFKLKALHQLGLKIILHTFEYGKGKPKALEKYCDTVFYYKRSKSPLNLLSTKPFIVKSRNNPALIKNLLKDTHPILFEGLHTTYPLNDYDFKNRTIFIRTHNIEHKYYVGLAKSETNLARKSFFTQEAKKLKKYQKILQKATYILTISPSEQVYFSNKFGDKAKYIPVFHKYEKVKNISGKGKFAMYHGDLRVADNLKACKFLFNVFKDLEYPLLIASSYEHPEIKKEIHLYKNISFVNLDTPDKLEKLFNETQVNVLPTFQKTGIKLKLIYALFESRFCLVNNAMVEDTGLEDLCEIADCNTEFKEKIKACFKKDYDKSEVDKRTKALKMFDNKQNASKILDLINKSF